MACLNPDYFSILLKSALYAPDMRAGLVHGDGTLFLRVPDIEGVTGMNLVSHPHTPPDTWPVVARPVWTGAGWRRRRVPHAGAAHHSAGSSRSDQPLAIYLSRDLSAVYANWNKNLLMRSILFGAHAGIGAGPVAAAAEPARA